jgi:hypothetical protein
LPYKRTFEVTKHLEGSFFPSVIPHAYWRLKGFHVGPGRNAAVKIARASIIEFAAKHQGRTITQAEIDRCVTK